MCTLITYCCAKSGLRCYYFDTNHVNIAPGVGRNKSTITTFFADQLGKAGGDYYTTYFPQPTWLTSRNYFLHYTGSNYAVLDFRHPQFFEMFVEGDTGGAEWHFQVHFLFNCVDSLCTI